MTREQKIEWLANADAQQLLSTYDFHSRNFNPFDEDTCESFELTKAEIIKRLSKQ